VFLRLPHWLEAQSSLAKGSSLKKSRAVLAANLRPMIFLGNLTIEEASDLQEVPSLHYRLSPGSPQN